MLMVKGQEDVAFFLIRWTDQIRTGLDTNLHAALHLAKERSKGRATLWMKIVPHLGNNDSQ